MKGIRIENISKSFKDFKAVDQVSFEVKKGELAALLGPSGSGKSTILRVIAGLEKPDTGRIFLDGSDVSDRVAGKRDVGFVFQHYALFKHMTAGQNIAFGLQVQKKSSGEIQKKVTELINLVKLAGFDHHLPGQLSGGQQQRVALARALAPEPSVLLLDEPFGSLDAKVRKNLAQWIRELHKRIHITGIFVTHDQNEAMEIADKIILINRGRVEQTGTPHEIYESPATRFAATFLGNVNVIDALVDEGRIFLNGAAGSVACLHDKESSGEATAGDVVLLVRPEDVIIRRDKDGNHDIPGAIAGIHYRGSFYELEVTVGGNVVTCFMDKDNFLHSLLRPNEEVLVDFKDYKVFEADEGYGKIHAMLKQYGYIE